MKDVIVNLKIPVDKYGTMMFDSKTVGIFANFIKRTIEEQSKEKDVNYIIVYSPFDIQVCNGESASIDINELKEECYNIYTESVY